MILLAVVLGLISFGLGIFVLVKLTMLEGLFKGMLGLIFLPYTFIWGWKKARSQNLTNTMIAWTAITIAQILLVVIAILIDGAG